MVLYHDRNVILYNPGEKPPFRSRRLTLEEAPGNNTELSNIFGRCPLCRQTVDARFAFVAQAYFELLQRLHRNSASTTATEPHDEVDLVMEGDLYKILGVSRGARLDDIKRAYRTKALRFHPDKNMHDPDAKLKFQKIAEAFSVLSDEQKRSKYDKSGDMDLDDFDMETFMNMVNASGLKWHKSAGDLDLEDLDMDFTMGCEEADSPPASLPPPMQPSPAETAEGAGSDLGVCDGAVVGAASVEAPNRNPFLANQYEVPEVIASEGGAEAEASAAASLRHLPPGLLNTGYYARFFVETRELGSGSFGSVFLCRHVLDDLTLGDYAVKKVPVGDNKIWLRDMVREVKTFERLHHPNIVEYKHSWLELSRTSPFCPFVPFLFILMQYCNGGSLDELIWQDGDPARPRAPLMLVQIWRFLFDILLGLQHLHRQGILHRDLKPTNILLQWPEDLSGTRGAAAASAAASLATGAGSGSGGGTMVPRALLSDFGTAAPLGELSTGVAAARGYTGTVEYTAPELLRGDAREYQYSEKSDMWSLGIVLYSMCFSALPFSHDDPSVLKDIIQKFVEERQGSAAADASAWLPQDAGGRYHGSLRLVTAALLAFDVDRRPSATDLLENSAFRAEALRYTRTVDFGEHAALPDS